MRVVEAKIQTVEDMYRLIWTAIANKQPISAIYKERNRLFCPHRLGRNRLGQRRVLCYQYGGESESGLAPAGSPENWRCIVFEKLRRMVPGRLPRTILALLRACWKRISMPRIPPSAIHRKDTEHHTW
jgi:hypothetical protein